MEKIHVVALLLVAVLVIAAGYDQRTKGAESFLVGELKVGDQAPDFSLSDETGTVRALSGMRGHKLALYFYPKDQTPGCTVQACSVRDGFKDLQEAGITVWGINYDSPEAHKSFKEAHNLNFPLLSDRTKQVAQRYGVRGWLVPDRITFLIDQQGRIVKVLKAIDVKNHAQQIIEAFEQK